MTDRVFSARGARPDAGGATHDPELSGPTVPTISH